MSYALRLTAEASAGLAALPFEVQEDAWDRLDALTNELAIATRPRRSSRHEVFDFDAFLGGRRYSVFFVAEIDHRIKTIHIISMGHVVRD